MGEQLSEHQRKRAIGEVWFANVNLCKSFWIKNFCSEAPTTVRQKFVVILSYVVTLNLYIFASLPCVKGDVSDSWQRDCHGRLCSLNKMCTIR